MIPHHLSVKSLASVDMTLTVWYIVLMTGLLWLWMWDIEATTWFLMLVSDITTAEWGSSDTWIIMLSRHLKWHLMSWLLLLFEGWKKMV